MNDKQKKAFSDAFKARVTSLGYHVTDSNMEGHFMDIRKGEELLISVSERGILSKSNPSLQAEIDILLDLYKTVKEAHDLYEQATPLHCVDVQEFRLISDLGNCLLAAKMDKNNEVRFVTWQYDYDRKGVAHGNYFETNLKAAKQDFAIRSGLIAEEQIFAREELTALYRACVFQGKNDEYMDYDSEKKLRNLMEKIEQNNPELLQTEVSIQMENQLERED